MYSVDRDGASAGRDIGCVRSWVWRVAVFRATQCNEAIERLLTCGPRTGCIEVASKRWERSAS
jgi:hypothetical protein